MTRVKYFFFCLLLMLVFPAAAQSLEFKVIALFKNAVMIEHDGKQKMIRNGQIYKDIKLLTADSHAAKFLIEGKELILGLHQSKTGNIFAEGTQKEKKFVRIPRDNTGMYRTAGFINGVSVKFLVDTGASQVAMNERTARRVGLQYKLNGEKTSVSTAAGRSYAWFLKLNKVNVGGVELKQVDALVIKGVGPDEVLLGMSFLRQLKMQDDGDLLKLTKKF